MFSCEFCEISKKPFFTEHLWWLLLIIHIKLTQIKLFFKAYKTTDKTFLCFFPIYKNVNIILSKKNKERLRKKTRERCQNFSEEAKTEVKI